MSIFIDNDEMLSLPEQVQKNKEDINTLKTKTGYVTYYRHHLELRSGEDASSSTILVELDIISKNSKIDLTNLDSELGNIPYTCNGWNNGLSSSLYSIVRTGTLTYEVYNDDRSSTTLTVVSMNDYVKEI